MRIGMNAYIAGRHHEGIARYITGLAEGLGEMGADVHTFSDRPLGGPLAVMSRQHVFKMPVYTLWEQLGLPMALARSKLSLFHAPGFVLPLLSFLPGVVTIHDLCYLLFPDCFPARRRRYFEWLVPPSLRKARLIIAVSRQTRDDLCKFMAVAEEKVRVVYNGVGAQFRPGDRRALSIRDKYGLPPKMALFVGRLEPRKNLGRLIRALSVLRRTRAFEHKLVLAGQSDFGHERLLQLRSELNIEDDVLFTGFVPDSDLPALYNAADLFIYPSLYEGFGLPLLEAMACGTPTITSRTSSLREVAGEASLLVDPYDTFGMAKAMADVLSSRSLREKLSEAGLKQAAKFTWSRAASETMSVYQEVLEQPSVENLKVSVRRSRS